MEWDRETSWIGFQPNGLNEFEFRIPCLECNKRGWFIIGQESKVINCPYCKGHTFLPLRSGLKLIEEIDVFTTKK